MAFFGVKGRLPSPRTDALLVISCYLLVAVDMFVGLTVT